MAISPDAATLYFTKAGAVWSVSLEQPGEPRKIHAGDGVAITPDGKNLIISFLEEPVRWAIVSLDTGREQPIRVAGDFSLTPVPPAPGSAARDGRIVLPIAVRDSWFYAPGLFDPATGTVQRIAVPYIGDFFDMGWTPDGKIVAAGYPFQSAIWRFTLSKRKVGKDSGGKQGPRDYGLSVRSAFVFTRNAFRAGINHAAVETATSSTVTTEKVQVCGGDAPQLRFDPSSKGQCARKA